MSTLKVTTIQTSAGGAVTLTNQHAAKAWANTNMSGTQSNRDSFNITSITDGGSGATTLGFTNSMNNADYSSVAERGTSNTTAYEISLPYSTFANTSSQYAWRAFNVAYSANVDATYVSTAIFGDLA